MNMFCRLSKHRRTCNFCWRSICVRVHYHYPTFLKYLMSPMCNNMSFEFIYILYFIFTPFCVWPSFLSLLMSRFHHRHRFLSFLFVFRVYLIFCHQYGYARVRIAVHHIRTCCQWGEKRQRLIKFLVAGVVCDTIFNEHDKSHRSAVQFEVHKAH